MSRPSEPLVADLLLNKGRQDDEAVREWSVGGERKVSVRIDGQGRARGLVAIGKGFLEWPDVDVGCADVLRQRFGQDELR